MAQAGPPSTLDAPPQPELRIVQTRDDDSAPSRLDTRAPAPSRIGRFSLIEQCGRGGMGVVFAAWDPQLDRKIAIKLVDDQRYSDADDARMRLEQEARAAATLNHPNIVTVYDVGVHEGRVFLAMEFVEGSTLGGWLRAAVRPWTEIVEMFLQVGRGLAAAHAAGLVHRDFKPDNVLVGPPGEGPEGLGRPRVADFGLAHSLEERRRANPSTIDESGPAGSSRRSSERSGTPAVAGTPAYMAPEQFDGLEIGPAADQFAFCVALFEGLFGKRPFAGGNYHALSISVRSGEIELPPDRPGVPRALVDLLLRGLDPSPQARHGSMEILLAKLDRVVHARRRRLRLAGGVAAASLAVVAGFFAARSMAEEPCEQADDPRAMWSAERRDAVVAGLGSDGSEAVAELDRHVTAIADKRREVCEATRVAGEQSDEALQLRMACLDRVAGRFAGLTDELAGGAGVARVDAAAISERLPPLSMCDDVETLAKLTNRNASRSARSSTEQDLAWSRAVELVERALTRRWLGRSDARAPAEEAAELARAHGLPGVESRALSVMADLELEAGAVSEAERLRREAVRLAVADGHEDAAVHMMLDGADAALMDGRLDEAEVHLAYFDAFVASMNDDEARADISRRAEIVRARLSLGRGDMLDAERRLTSLDLASLPELDRRAAWMALGTAQRALGKDEEATATWTALLGLVESMRGSDHPDVAAVLNNLAIVRLDALQPEPAERLLERAQQIVVAAEGERAPLVAALSTNRGWAARLAGRHADARRHLERSLELGRALHGPRHPALAYALDELGELARAEGDLEGALEHFAAAGELRDATLGPNHPETATTLVGMARVFLAQQNQAQARGALEAALRIVQAHPGSPRKRERIEALLEVARTPAPVAPEVRASSARGG